MDGIGTVAIAVAIVGVLVVAFIIARANNRRRQLPPVYTEDVTPREPDNEMFTDRGTPDDDSNLQDLRVGGWLTWQGTMYSVCGKAHYRDGVFIWNEYYLDDGKAGKRWLSVAQSTWHDAIIWTELEGFDPADGPVVEYDGITYRRSETGTAGYETQGDTGLPEVDYRVVYSNYVYNGQRNLAVRSFDGGPRQICIGTSVSASELIIRPPV